jgi:hypothetical protein
MSSLQQAFLITSAHDGLQMILAVTLLIVAGILFRQIATSGADISTSKRAKTLLSADYWIERRKRKGFSYRT